MKLRRGQKIAKEVLEFEVVNPRERELEKFSKGDIVSPIMSTNPMECGIVEEIDNNISKVIVNYNGNIKQCDPDEIRIYVLANSLKQARRVKKASL
jgi:hypothetical protein